MAKKKSRPIRSKDVPATLGMLHIVRDELRSELRSLEHKMDSGFLRVDGKLLEMRADMKSDLALEISGVKSELIGVKSKLASEISGVKSKLASEISGVKSELALEISGVKSELVSEIAEVKSELASEISGVKSELAGVKSELASEIAGVKSELIGVKSEVAGVKSVVEKMSSHLHQIQLLAEEQRAENKIVMDGLTSLFARQERLEDRFDSVEKMMSPLKR